MNAASTFSDPAAILRAPEPVDLDDGWTGEASNEQEAWFLRNGDAIRALCEEALEDPTFYTDEEVGAHLEAVFRDLEHKPA